MRMYSVLFNCTVEQLCSITFLSEITGPNQSVNLSELLRSRDRNAHQRKVGACAEKHVCGKLLIYNTGTVACRLWNWWKTCTLWNTKQDGTKNMVAACICSACKEKCPAPQQS